MATAQVMHYEDWGYGRTDTGYTKQQYQQPPTTTSHPQQGYCMYNEEYMHPAYAPPSHQGYYDDAMSAYQYYDPYSGYDTAATSNRVADTPRTGHRAAPCPVPQPPQQGMRRGKGKGAGGAPVPGRGQAGFQRWSSKVPPAPPQHHQQQQQQHQQHASLLSKWGFGGGLEARHTNYQQQHQNSQHHHSNANNHYQHNHGHVHHHSQHGHYHGGHHYHDRHEQLPSLEGLAREVGVEDPRVKTAAWRMYVVAVRYRLRDSTLCWYRAPLKPGEPVLVSADRGFDMGHVVSCHPASSAPELPVDPRSAVVFRPATAKEAATWEEQRRERERQAVQKATEILRDIASPELHDLTFVDAVFQYDGRKLTLYYETTTTDYKPYRPMLKPFFGTFGCRIWLQKMSGSSGPTGSSSSVSGVDESDNTNDAASNTDSSNTGGTHKATTPTTATPRSSVEERIQGELWSDN